MVPSARFFLWSIALAAIVGSLIFGLRDPADIATIVAKTVFMVFVSLSLIAVQLGIWWCLGSQMKSREWFRIFAYVAGAMVVFWIPVATFVMSGTWHLLGWVPEYRSRVLLAEFLIFLTVIQVWIRPAQQWFRQRQGLTRWRSLLAQTLALLSLPIILLIYYVAYYGLVRMSG